MAWAARIDAVADDGDGHVQVSVTYWLDTDVTFTNKLGGATMSFGPGTTLAGVQAAIITQGQQIRAGQVAVAGLISRVGSVVVVP